MTGKHTSDNLDSIAHQRKLAGETKSFRIMKQPELGKKLTELRKARGLTQEELVEKCNISVRTIQRIEAGEVTPRSYTVKSILDVLDYDFKIITEENSLSITGLFNRFLFLDTDFKSLTHGLVNQLNIALIFGLLYFLIGFLDGAVEYHRYEDGTILMGNMMYISVKLAILITATIFLRGFIIIGGVFNNYLLRITTILIIFGNFLVIGYDIASLFYEATERKFVLVGESLTFGTLGVLYGLALLKSAPHIGKTASVAGIFEVIAGACFISVILALLGFIFLIPAELFEIIVIFKSIEIIKSRINS